MKKVHSTPQKSHFAAELTHYQPKYSYNQCQHSIAETNKWTMQLIENRISELTEKENSLTKQISYMPECVDSPILKILENISGDEADFTLLALALCSKLYEQSLHQLINIQENFPQIGGVVRRINKEFVPTVQTAAFLFNGNNVDNYADSHKRVANSRLIREGIIELIETDQKADLKNLMIRLNNQYLEYITHGVKPELGLTPDFPAQLLKTTKTFNDLILKESTRQQLEDILLFARHRKALFESDESIPTFTNGFIGLFWGPPGTGKSLTASVIGNELGIEVYRVDLSRVVSKYIGETEKNLEKIFQRFDGKNCILFFDEADALFGKRSTVNEAKDRYANQEISYLLQRVETFGGLVILASNLKENMDDAFKRRVLSFVFFPRPDAIERHKLWQIHLPEQFQFESEQALSHLAEKYELTGSHIANILKLSCLRALGNQTKILTLEIIEPYVAEIYKHEGLRKTIQRTAVHKRK